MPLTKISFSDGIREEDIQNNFDVLDKNAKADRLCLAGSGVASGFNWGFDTAASIAAISNGIYVDNNGELYAIAGASFKIAPPEDTEGKYPRIDIIYINTSYNIVYQMGTHTVASPSVDIPADCSTMLYAITVGFLKTNGQYKENESVSDIRIFRRIYIDKDNKICIDGIPFTSYKLINIIKPDQKYITEDIFWYDSDDNILYVYKTINGIADWYAVNTQNMYPVVETKIWKDTDIQAGVNSGTMDMQKFLFDLKSSTPEVNLLYIPNDKELFIIIDNIPLMSDQFDEVVGVYQSVNGVQTLLEVFSDTTGYYVLPDGTTKKYIDKDYYRENGVGMGFKLKEKLDKPVFIEVRVTHRISKNPLTFRYQRTASFAVNGTIIYQPTNTTLIFETSHEYAYGENQLEVFLNGRRLNCNIDYTEGDGSTIVQGTMTKFFKLSSSLSLFQNDIIAYKITKNVYAYDNMANVLDDIKNSSGSSVQQLNDLSTNLTKYENSTNDTIGSLKQQISNVSTEANKVENCMKSTDLMKINNLDSTVIAHLVKNLISETVTKSGAMLQVNDIAETDFVVMYDLTRNVMLRRDVDFSITTDTTSKKVYIKFSSNLPDGRNFYITGFKIGGVTA